MMGVLSMLILLEIMIVLCIIKNASVYSNPFRRGIMMCVILAYSVNGMWLSIGGLVGISSGLPLL